ncbi:MAG TPA: hydrogenase [Candidatus Omnitrophota bacterium]|nr:hydrogenase [Candidatus Omnitrophota bacterium]HPN55784.1 hydrogenase [Candidatus Omnitrophota bacterium]
MTMWVDFIIVAVLLLDLMMLSSSRIRNCIQIAAVQGTLVGLMPLFVESHPGALSPVVASFFSIFLKGVVFPWLLFRALREANIRKEVEPIGGYPLSLLMGVVMFAMGFWLSKRLLYPDPFVPALGAPVSFATFFTGVFLIISRMKAITQVIGYLILENGIYLFGAVFLGGQSLLVELAILLDIFAAVFVMGITIFHINREFDHIDTQKLSELKDIITSK